MKKVLAFVLACMMLVSMASLAVAQEETVKLRFMWWGGDARHEATLQVIDNYMAAHPNVTIEPEFGGSDGYLEKLSTQLYSRTAADIIQCGTGWLPDLVNNGIQFVNYYDYPEQIDLSGFTKSYIEEIGMFDGKQVGLPTGVACNVILVNTTLADELGIDYSTQLTWNSIIELGRQVQEKDPSKYLLNTDSPNILTEIFRPYITQLTGKPAIDDASGSMSFTREQLIQVLDYISSLYENNVFQPAEDSAAFKSAIGTNPKWIAGDFVMGYCVSSTITTLTDACPDAAFDVVQLPLKEDRLNDGFTSSPPQLMVIPTSTKHVDVCLDFLDYFYNSDEAALILKDVRSVPPVDSARAICSENNLILPIVEKAVNLGLELSGANEMGLTTSAEVEAVFMDMIENVAYGTRSNEEIADDGIRLLEGILAE